MPDWNNWRWQKQINHIHSSRRKANMGKKRKKTVLKQDITRFTVQLRFIPTLLLAIVFVLAGMNELLSIVVSIIFGMLFGLNVTRTIK